jgi:hypothetical protein
MTFEWSRNQDKSKDFLQIGDPRFLKNVKDSLFYQYAERLINHEY